MINQDGTPNFGTIYVEFEVVGVVYAVGEVINGCEIIRKDVISNAFICSTDKANIMLNFDPSLESIKNEQKISVRVGRATYKLGAQKVAINAIPYLPSKTLVAFEVGQVGADIAKHLTLKIIEARTEEAASEAIKTANPKAWKFFYELLYAYNKEQPTPRDATAHNIFDVISKFPKNTKYISRDPRINPAEPILYGYENMINDDVKMGPKLPAKEILAYVIDDYCNGLRVVREMVEIYGSDGGVFKSHENFWKILNKGKTIM
jgi:hypothetical protein